VVVHEAGNSSEEGIGVVEAIDEVARVDNVEFPVLLGEFAGISFKKFDFIFEIWVFLGEDAVCSFYELLGVVDTDNLGEVGS
jgi:hypothetical protein